MSTRTASSNFWRLAWRFSRPVKLALDLAAWTLAIPVALLLRLEGDALARMGGVLGLAALGLLAALALTLALGLHRQSWGRVGLRDLSRLSAAGIAWAAVLETAIAVAPGAFPVPRSVPLIALPVALAALGGMRLAVRVLDERRLLGSAGPGARRKAVILGAGEGGTMLAREISRHPEWGFDVAAFLDDDAAKRGVKYSGVPVLGPLSDLPAAVRSTRADEALFCIPSAPAHVRRESVELARRNGIPLRVMPSLASFVGAPSPLTIRDVMRAFVTTGEPRNVLLVGGAGYIGSALVPLLLERGYHVRVLDAVIYGTGPIEPYLNHPRFELVQGDFRQVNVVVEALQGMDTVVHLGGLVGDPACALDEDLTVEINLMATKMVAEVAKGYGISRFIFASTCSVYGASDELLDEESAFNPVSLYARTKIASERILMRMADEHFSPTILRFATVYGLSGRTRFDLVVNLLTAKAATEGVITLFGGDQWRPFVHVEDVARAVRLAIEAPREKTAGRIYNVGHDSQNYTLAQAAEVIRSVIPAAKIVDSGLDSDRRNYRVSFRRIQDELGFEPAWTLERGIRQVHEALERGAVKDYKDPIYSNVRFLTEEGLSRVVRREFSAAQDALDEPDSQPVVTPRR